MAGGLEVVAPAEGRGGGGVRGLTLGQPCKKGTKIMNLKGFLSLIFLQMIKNFGVIFLISYSNNNFNSVIFFKSF